MLGNQAELRRRLRAARALARPHEAEREQRRQRRAKSKSKRKRNSDLEEAGLSVEELAARLIAEGERLGKDTLGNIERGVRDLRQPDLRAIARVCGLPEAFFVADFSRLPEISPRRPDLAAANGEPTQAEGAQDPGAGAAPGDVAPPPTPPPPPPDEGEDAGEGPPTAEPGPD